MDEKKTSAALPAPSPVEYGGRVELRLMDGAQEGDSVTRYAARWFTSDQEIQGEVTVAAPDAQIAIHSPPELPDWLSSFTTNLVRTTARTAQKDKIWPRRLTRWRNSPTKRDSSGSEPGEGQP